MAFELHIKDYEMLKKDLDVFLENSEARSALLCDSGGNIIVQTGKEVSASPDQVSALTAATFAATKELASMVGEKEFRAIFHQGASTSLFISGVCDDVLLLAMFSEETNPGLVRMYALTTCRKINSVFDEVMKRPPVRSADPTRQFTMRDGPLF